jgi:putative ABC transport system substrate-binding protein
MLETRYAMKKGAVPSILVAVVLLALGVIAEAQQATKVPRIGYLSGSSISANPPWREAFRQGLRDLGYEEGKSIIIEWRFAEGKADRVPALLAAPPELLSELVRLKVDVIVAVGAGDTRAAKEATATIPLS